MRWNSSFPDIGDTRKREGFLWFPKTVNGETRWLEHARWEECYGKPHPDVEEGWMASKYDITNEWHPFRWLPRNTGTSPAVKPDPPYKPPTSSPNE